MIIWVPKEYHKEMKPLKVKKKILRITVDDEVYNKNEPIAAFMI